MKTLMGVTVLLALVMGGSLTCVAADTVVTFLPGWDPLYTFAAAGENIAFLLHPSDADSPTKAVQKRGPLFVITDLPGQPISLQYSESGTHLLVMYYDQFASSTRAAVISAEGSVLWTKPAGRRSFQFSANGSAVWSMNTSDPTEPIEVFNVTNGYLRQRWTLDLALGKFHGAAVPGSGEEIIVVAGYSVMRLASGSGAVNTVWRMDLPDDNPRPTGLDAIGPDTFVVTSEDGVSEFFDGGGARLYGYDPVALATANPSRTIEFYSGLQPFRGAGERSVLLYSGQAVGATLNLTSGQLTERTYDNATVTGFTRLNYIVSNLMVLLSADAARIRSF